MLRHTLAIGFATAFFFGSPVFAAALEDGRDAYQKGDYAAALKLLRPLADAGNPEAQVFVGMSYEFGDGVTKNTAESMPPIISGQFTRTATALRKISLKQ
jgi:TPR repeat protein